VSPGYPCSCAGTKNCSASNGQKALGLSRSFFEGPHPAGSCPWLPAYGAYIHSHRSIMAWLEKPRTGAEQGGLSEAGLSLPFHCPLSPPSASHIDRSSLSNTSSPSIAAAPRRTHESTRIRVS
jgi:hypothetical protein